MPALSNQRHERFAQEIAQGTPQVEAYGKVGYKPVDANASRLINSDKVRTRIAELQGKAAQKLNVTIESLMQEADEIQRAAKADKQHSASVAAMTAKAKLAGLWVERSDNVNTNANYAISDEPESDADWSERHTSSH
jgi:hypothetical protein